MPGLSAIPQIQMALLFCFRNVQCEKAFLGIQTSIHLPRPFFFDLHRDVLLPAHCSVYPCDGVTLQTVVQRLYFPACASSGYPERP